MRILYTLFLLSLTQFLSAQQQPGSVGKKLHDRLEAEPQAWHSVHLVLANRVDLAALDAQLSLQKASPERRAQTVLEALKNKASETQGDLVSLLKNSPLVQPSSVRSYWVANAIFFKAKKEMLEQLSQRSDVAWLGLNGKLEVEKFECSEPPPFEPNGIEPGLAAIDAPALWAMGYTGYGQIAFTNDTGIDPTHPALASRYRGFYASKESAWFQLDSLTFEPGDNTQPFDCQEHGTHVNGTILGLDRLENDTVGVAFNAHWIGAPIICGIGTEDNVGAFQWSLDPDGDPGTSEDIPDIINNSWYDPSLDTLDCFSVYVPISEAMEAAGIAVVFSAGNEGPDPMTITQPHNINLNEVNAFTVAAVNANNPALLVANFSSRGPSHCGGEGSLLIKPEVAAPGVSVRSCVPGKGYDFFQGTSMASPHVSGAILLLKEAFPNLTGKQLKLAIYHSCTDLGNPGEDNTYGMGIINVKSAFDSLVAQGHVPVSPWRANDVLMVDMQVNEWSCSDGIFPLVIVENGGTDSLFSFVIQYEVEGFSTTQTWTGALAPRERTTLNLSPLTASPGNHELTVELALPNGVEDERPLNNIFKKYLYVADRSPFTAQAAGAPAVSVCEGDPALLLGVYEGSGAVSVQWFDAAMGGNQVGEGLAFVTPPLNQATTFFAEALYREKVGETDKNIGESLLSTGQDMGMTFSVNANVRLKSVKVYLEQTGARLFTLRSEGGDIINQSLKTISQTGEVQLTFNWDMTPGNYILEKSGGKPLYYNTVGADYPYNHQNLFAITGTNDDLGEDGAWYFFYDWEIEYTEPCGRTAVSVVPVSGADSPSASFTASADSIDLLNGGEINFTSTSSGTEDWHWYFGDGSFSSLEHPSHTYTQPGIYVVSLSVVGNDGCSDFALDTIEVTKTEINALPPSPRATDEISAYPNPFSNKIQVLFELSSSQAVRLELSDLTGRVLKTADYPQISRHEVRMDASTLPSGVYFLTVQSASARSVFRVVKQ